MSTDKHYPTPLNANDMYAANQAILHASMPGIVAIFDEIAAEARALDNPQPMRWEGHADIKGGFVSAQLGYDFTAVATLYRDGSMVATAGPRLEEIVALLERYRGRLLALVALEQPAVVRGRAVQPRLDVHYHRCR